MNHPVYSPFTYARSGGSFSGRVDRGGADTLDEALRLAHAPGYGSPGERIEVRGPTNTVEVVEVAEAGPGDSLVWKRVDA